MIEIAKILKPQGINGEVKVQLFSDNVEGFAKRAFAYLKNGEKLNYAVNRVSQGFVFMNIDGINTRSDAELYNGVFLYIGREDFAEPEEDEYYICDLIGLEVKDETGASLGKLKEVLQNGAADVYVVKGTRNFMFPALKIVIKEVTDKYMVLDTTELGRVAVYDD